MASKALTVIREFAPNVWIFSYPFKIGFLPLGGRTAAIKLNDGGLWVMASHPLEDETKAKIHELGDVKYIVSGDAGHHYFLGVYKKEWPGAKLIGVEPLVKKKPDLKFDGVYGVDPPETKYGYEDEIETIHFTGYTKSDVAFFHKASKTLIQADLLFNLPATEQFSKTGSSGSIPFLSAAFKPTGALHKVVINGAVKDKAAMKRDATAVAAWDFDKIITTHGDCIEKDAKKAWNDAYKHLL